MMKTKQFALSTACALALLASAPLAIAQGGAQQYQQGNAPQQQQSQTDVSDKQLKAYAEAAQEVITVQQDLQKEMSSAGSNEEAQKLQGEAQAKMIEAVEDSGMSVEEYNKIANIVQSDPAVRAKVEEMIN